MLTGLAVIQKVIPGLRPLPGSTFRGEIADSAQVPKAGNVNPFF